MSLQVDDDEECVPAMAGEKYEGFPGRFLWLAGLTLLSLMSGFILLSLAPLKVGLCSCV